MDPVLVAEFVAEYHRELNQLNASCDDLHIRDKDELVRVERQIRAIIEAIKDGLRSASMREKLVTLKSRKSELEAKTKIAPPPVPRLHPNSQTFTVRRSQTFTAS